MKQILPDGTQRPTRQMRFTFSDGRAISRFWPPSRVLVYLMSVIALASGLVLVVPEELGANAVSTWALSSSIPGENNSEWRYLIPFMFHAFLHGSFFHLSTNLIWMLVVGQVLCLRFGAGREQSGLSQLVGGMIFVSFFLSAAVFSGIIFVLSNLFEPVILVGASGGISALLAASIRVSLRRHQPLGVRYGKSLSLLDWKVLFISVLFIGVNVVMAPPVQAMIGLDGGNGKVAWEAHIAGYMYGLIMFSFFDRLTLKLS